MSHTPEQWREQWSGKLHTPDDLVHFVDSVGCCTTKPLPGWPGFPNQSEAMGQPALGVPDPWFWKDDLHIEKRIYYTRLFGGQPGFISFELLPAFMATNGAIADELIFEGLLSPETRHIYQTIEAHGPIPTKQLKRMLSPDTRRSANRVLIELDRRFLITKTGITGRTLGTYSYIWDLVERWLPDMLSAADRLGRKRAEALLTEHLAAYGIPPRSSFYTRTLGWGI